MRFFVVSCLSRTGGDLKMMDFTMEQQEYPSKTEITEAFYKRFTQNHGLTYCSVMEMSKEDYKRYSQGVIS